MNLEMLNSLRIYPLITNISVESVSSSSHIDQARKSDQSGQEDDEIVEPRRSKRQRTEKSFGNYFITTFVVDYPNLINDYVVSAFLVSDDPKSYSAAMTSVDALFWRETI